MNILVFSWRDPKHPLAGGAEQVMHEHMKGWIAGGHSVTLFSSKLKHGKGEEIFEGVNIVRAGHQYLGVQLAGFYYYLKNGNNFDFLVDQFHGVPFFTPLYSRKPKLAVIQEPARDVWLKNPLPRPMNLLVGLLGYIFEPLFFLFYKKVPFMTGSNSAKENLVSYGIAKPWITVVPHGVLKPIGLKIPKKSKVKTITFFGVISKDKGIEDAIRAFKILSEFGNYDFWVMGGPETESYFKYVKKFARRLGIFNKIKFWGYVGQEKKFNLLSKSWLLINPSVHEGWGLVNVEANVVGTPVVAYNSPGLVDSVKDGLSGQICGKSPKEMAQAVLSILQDPSKYSKLRKGATIWSKTFDWKKSRKISLKLINKVYLGR